jgi:acetylornithine/LysW-gamma-L-lysine aminotransferase
MIAAEATDIRTLEGRLSSGVYAKRALTVVRGQAATVWDDQGRSYIDCTSGQGVANVGHCHPDVIAAIQAQAATLITCQEALYNDQRALLLAELTATLPNGLERVFLCNSGAEAVEAAIKFARVSTGRPGIVAAMRCFHGRTFGALSATWEAHYREPFQPLVPGFTHVPYNNVAALEAAITDETAAVLLEIVQGEGGVRLATAEFLQGAQALCRERGALLLIDEIQTGCGRTGTLWACQHHDLQPDILMLGKAIAGGLPMGVTALGSGVVPLKPGLHGSTFGGNPLACAAARATLQVLHREQLATQAATNGIWLMEQLQALPSERIREVRGLGLMIGIELRERAAPYIQKMQEHGVLVLPAGPTVIRLLPPLVISESELATVVQVLCEVLR